MPIEGVPAAVGGCCAPALSTTICASIARIKAIAVAFANFTFPFYCAYTFTLGAPEIIGVYRTSSAA